MKRRPIKLFTALYLLLSVAAGTLCVRSYFSDDSIALSHGAYRLSAHSSGGRVALAYCNAASLGHTGGSTVRWDWAGVTPAQGAWAALGFERGRVDVARPTPFMGDLPMLGRLFSVAVPGHYIRVPWWLVVALATIAPAAWLVRAGRRRGRRRKGLCIACGYGLRASPGRCPECGRKE